MMTAVEMLDLALRSRFPKTFELIYERAVKGWYNVHITPDTFEDAYDEVVDMGTSSRLNFEKLGYVVLDYEHVDKVEIRWGRV